ncbi:MAG: protocatechuate 3,4-dioxygenase subunit alpha [Bryobacteraceae bacterium]
MVTSPNSTIGPFFPYEFMADDLTQHEGKRAHGQHILLTGRVLQEGCVPTRNTILEIWQADANGVFRHPLDPRCPQADPGFAGWGRARTDPEGWYRFRTVLPGAYEKRCPHINVMVLAIGLTWRLVSTIFFSAAPETADDPVLNCVTDPAARLRLFAKRDSSLDVDGVRAYRFDVILRGENETPFFLD